MSTEGGYDKPETFAARQTQRLWTLTVPAGSTGSTADFSTSKHHLFPRIPRHNLPHVKPLVMRFCKDNDLVYHSYGFVKGNGTVLSALKADGEQARLMAEIANELSLFAPKDGL